MNSKNKFVVNFTGFSHWTPGWQEWMLKMAASLPMATFVLFDYDLESPETIKIGRVESFKSAEELMNWLPTHAESILNLVPVFEPVVCPVPSILILPIFKKSQFWSVDMPNSLGYTGEGLKELGLRQNVFVSNSEELIEMVGNTCSRDESLLFTKELDSITAADVNHWADLAIADFHRASVVDSPLVSIVTPSYNQAKFLGKTLDSVFSQDYQNVEYFVVDGGSTDNSLEVLGRYQGRVHWVSEKDSGYPEAVNKGFQKCSGKYMMWLPSDDMLFSKSSISSLVKAAEENNADVVFGDAFYVDQDDRYLGSYRTACYSPEKLRDWLLICQPAALFRADVFRKVGGLNQGFRCISDYDLWLRMSDAGAKFQRVGRPISCYRIHGESLTVKQKNISYKEIFDLQLSRYSVVNRSWVMGAFKEIVLQQNLGLRWNNLNKRTEPNALWNSRIVRRLIKFAFESFLAENPYFQRFIRRMIEPREPIWGRGR